MRSAVKKQRKKQRPLAQRLRQNSTNAEMLFWLNVRDRRFMGLKFKRQTPIGGYVVDFICPERGLIVEIDGGQHNESQKDIVRDKHLASKNLKVLRFWNNDVLANIDGVLAVVENELGSLSPVRAADGGRGQGVRGRTSKGDDSSCCATPSSRPSPAMRRSRTGEKGKERRSA